MLLINFIKKKEVNYIYRIFFKKFVHGKARKVDRFCDGGLIKVRFCTEHMGISRDFKIYVETCFQIYNQRYSKQKQEQNFNSYLPLFF